MSEEREIGLRSGFDTSDGSRRVDIEFKENGDITLLLREKTSGHVADTVDLSFSDVDRLADELTWARQTFRRANAQEP